jgi:1-piperideine-2-carboxylate/1-pyrroline-2-carboxylate reductase [NAD(P)H]
VARRGRWSGRFWTYPGGGKLLVMPAADGELAITKLVTVHPGNAALGLPTIQGEVVVMDAANGKRLGLREGAAVTGRRTAALSLLASRRLAPVPDGPLLIVGAGVQARAHLEALCDRLAVARVVIASRTRSRAEALAAYAGELGVGATVSDDPDEASRGAKVIVTATSSTVPVLTRPLEEDAMVCAVGAFPHDIAELAPEVVADSSVVVDTVAASQEEAGDLIVAAESGGWSWEQALPLAELLAEPGRRLAGPIVFKSVGHALFDLAAARLAFLGRAG